jgi:hypothetical protein
MMAGIYGYIMLLWSWGSAAKAKAYSRQSLGVHRLLAMGRGGAHNDASMDCPLLLMPEHTPVSRVPGESFCCPCVVPSADTAVPLPRLGSLLLVPDNPSLERGLGVHPYFDLV